MWHSFPFTLSPVEAESISAHKNRLEDPTGQNERAENVT